MRRIVVVLVLGLVVSVWPAAGGIAHGSTATQAAPTRSLQADFNNDGADDLAVGVPLENVGASVGAGAVNVLYGSATGLTGSGSQLLSQDTPGVPGGAETDDGFGSTLATGDFNNDTFADLAVGAPGEGVGATVAAGAVNVLYGSATGLTGTGSQLFTQVGGTVETGDQFGSALAAGDFDNDTFIDLAAGAPFEGVGAIVDAGALSVLRGSSAGLSVVGGQLFTQVGGTVEAGDLFGFAVAAGDFDNDTFTDLAAGAPLEDVGSTADAGALSVLRGSSAGLSVVGGQLFTQVGGTVEAGDLFGLAVAAGDFDNDTFTDLAAGAPTEGVSSTVAAGAVSVLPGSASGLSAVGGQLFTQVGGAVEAGDEFGSVVAAGDFDNDSFADLAAGAPFEDVGSAVDAGAVSALPGSASGLSAVGGQLFTQDTPGVPGSAQELEFFGFTLATGDPGPAAAPATASAPAATRDVPARRT
jgi:FG-GAP repeat